MSIFELFLAHGSQNQAYPHHRSPEPDRSRVQLAQGTGEKQKGPEGQFLSISRKQENLLQEHKQPRRAQILELFIIVVA